MDKVLPFSQDLDMQKFDNCQQSKHEVGKVPLPKLHI